MQTDSRFIRLPPGLFVTATGTGAGKTFVTRALAAALYRSGINVAAIKPIETGSFRQPGTGGGQPGTDADDADGTDAGALAAASGRPELACAAGLYRAPMPASPRAVSLALGSAPPDLERLAQAIAEAALGSDLVLVEGAGGLLVPVDSQRTMADLALRLSLPIILVAPNALGVLSHALTAFESAERRSLAVAAVILTDLAPERDESDPSRPYNAAILQERLPCPVLSFPYCTASDDESLAAAAISANLLSLLPHATRSRQ